MENIKSAVMAVCIVSASKCLIGSIASASRLKNQLGMLLNLLLAVVMISPFANGIAEFELPEISDYRLAEYNSSDDVYALALAEQTAVNIESVLFQQISAMGLSCEKIEAEVNISYDYSISISRVTVTSEDFEAVAGIIRRSLGDGTEVVNAVD
ncbi:MAG: hypothetical protein NC340_06470 [Ruminococcus flavefaciens]|nr:hypothetical protein [Ruminococcus flavefaciens]MCM1229728.1 hypothetical protein [Ruminococcus flavefaciens]